MKLSPSLTHNLNYSHIPGNKTVSGYLCSAREKKISQGYKLAQLTSFAERGRGATFLFLLKFPNNATTLCASIIKEASKTLHWKKTLHLSHVHS